MEEKNTPEDQSKSLIVTDAIKQSKTDNEPIDENYQQNQILENFHLKQYQQNEIQKFRSMMDENACISLDAALTKCLESSPSEAKCFTQQIDFTTKNNQSDQPILEFNNERSQLCLMPKTTELLQSLKATLSNTENDFIQKVRISKEIMSTSVVTQSDKPTQSAVTLRSETIVEKTSKIADPTQIIEVTTKKPVLAITRKESESFNEENTCSNDNTNNNKSTTDIKTNKNNEMYTNYEVNENKEQTNIIALPPPIPIKTEDMSNTTTIVNDKLLSAVCKNLKINESKSEVLTGKNDDDDEKANDIDVITISSTDDNSINNNYSNMTDEEEKTEQEQQKLTEKSLMNSMNLQRTHSKTETVLEYLNSVEPTVAEIQDKLIEFDNIPSSSGGDHSSVASTNILNDSESEEDDQLKPLMQDNHTTIVNHEFYIYNNTNDKCQNQNYVDIMKNRPLTSVNYSSTDSDLSTQFDQRDLTGTISQNSSDDCNDSGLDIPSSSVTNNKNTSVNQLKHLAPTPPAPATSPVNCIIMKNSEIDVSPSPTTLTKTIATTTTQTVTTKTIATETEDQEVREIDTLMPMEIPDDKMCEDIVEQVEYYFSNENILKDAFLLKHVRRNKEGFVSLKLVSSFKRVRQFTKDWRVVGNAVERKSKKIELNDVGTKIRRFEPLPNFDETMPSRTIVVCDLPYEKLSIDKITDIFSKCGEIALIRILRPGMQIPVDVRQFMNKYPEMQQKECALVEYIDSASARFAKSMQGNYKVFDMVAPKKKTGKKSITTITKFIENYKYPDSNYERTRGGVESGHHHYHSHSHHGHHHVGYITSNNNNNNNQQSHHNHYSLINNHNQVLQNNNSTNTSYENEFRAKLRSNYDNRPSQNAVQQQSPTQQQSQTQQQQPQQSPATQQQQQNQESQTQTQSVIYIPPQLRRYSSSDQENINRDHIHNMNVANNLYSTNNSSNSNLHFSHYPPRRMSNSSVNDSQSRKYSSCSEGYSSCSEYSRRPSLTSTQDSSSRKTSSCSDYCPCSRRASQCSENNYRKISQNSDIVNAATPFRRFSNGSFHGFDRQYNTSNANDQVVLNNHNNIRRISFDSNYDRKLSTSSINSNNNNINNNINQQPNNGQYICENHLRKFSNGFDPNRKLSFTDQYFNGRRISTDSGYDRKLSFSSDVSSTSTSPRSRANSFIVSGQLKPRDIVVRTPIGPDDNSKGFMSRARKVGQVAVESV